MHVTTEQKQKATLGETPCCCCSVVVLLLFCCCSVVVLLLFCCCGCGCGCGCGCCVVVVLLLFWSQLRMCVWSHHLTHAPEQTARQRTCKPGDVGKHTPRELTHPSPDLSRNVFPIILTTTPPLCDQEEKHLNAPHHSLRRLAAPVACAAPSAAHVKSINKKYTRKPGQRLSENLLLVVVGCRLSVVGCRLSVVGVGCCVCVCVCFVLFCFVLFCFVLFCFVLFCFVLFCFVWFGLVWVWFGLVGWLVGWLGRH